MIFILFTFIISFIIIRSFYALFCYEEIIELVTDYSIFCLYNDIFFDLSKEFDNTMPEVEFILKFWIWDKWKIINVENREKIRDWYYKNK